MNQGELVSTELEKLLIENPLFAKETIVFEKNSNSSLVQKVLPCNMGFFDRLFNNVFWELYSELGLSTKPFGCKYLNFIGNEMFFCANTEERFLKNIGAEKKFQYSKSGKIIKKTPISAANIIFLAAMPFELAKNSANVSIDAFKINDELQYFEEHYANSFSFWKKNNAIDNPVSVSLQATAGALQSMRYSLLSSLAFSLKIRLRQSFAIQKNILKELIIFSIGAKEAELKENAGFFSLAPYDISEPFLEENPSLADFLKKIPAPTEPHYILRENAKLCCSMHLSVLRKCFLKIAESNGLKNNVFFLQPSELPFVFSDIGAAEKLCKERKEEFDEAKKIILPARIAIEKNNFFFEAELEEKEIFGTSVGAKNIAEGRLVFVESFRDFGKVSEGDIIFSKNFSPELVVFYGKAVGVLSTAGSLLAHSAIVAREKELPCIVQLKGSQLLKEGSRIRINGGTGKISPH